MSAERFFAAIESDLGMAIISLAIFAIVIWSIGR